METFTIIQYDAMQCNAIHIQYITIYNTTTKHQRIPIHHDQGKKIDSFSSSTLLTKLWPFNQGGMHFESVLEER